MSDDFEGDFRASWSGSNSKREPPKNVSISVEQVAEAAEMREREDSISLTTAETSTISTDNIHFDHEHDQERGQERQDREGVQPSKDLVEETCFECSTSFLISLEDATATELALCIKCKNRQLEIENSFVKVRGKMRSSRVARNQGSSSSSSKSKRVSCSEGVVRVDSVDHGIKGLICENSTSNEREYGDTVLLGGNASTEGWILQSEHNISSSSSSSPHAPKPNIRILEADVIHKMREDNLVAMFLGGGNESNYPVFDSSKSLRTKQKRKQSKPRSLKEILRGDTPG